MLADYKAKLAVATSPAKYDSGRKEIDALSAKLDLAMKNNASILAGKQQDLRDTSMLSHPLNALVRFGQSNQIEHDNAKIIEQKKYIDNRLALEKKEAELSSYSKGSGKKISEAKKENMLDEAAELRRKVTVSERADDFEKFLTDNGVPLYGNSKSK